jgi:hypothetical protein
MIERISTLARVYMGLTELHTYTQATDPKTQRQLQEHLVVRIYDKTAKVEEYNKPHKVDLHA